MTSKAQHVIPSGGRWRVRRTGAARASGVYDTQAEAINRARELAKSQGGELFIHGKDGQIRERRSFGAETASAKV